MKTRLGYNITEHVRGNSRDKQKGWRLTALQTRKTVAEMVLAAARKQEFKINWKNSKKHLKGGNSNAECYGMLY